jgi:DNA recombination protein RmuC
MDTVIVVLLAILIILALAAAAGAWRQGGRSRLEAAERMAAMQGQLLETTGRIDTRLDGAQQTMAGVQEKLVELGEAGKRIHEVGRDISGLQDLLKPPKLRGIMGETMLRELLNQMLPNNCEFQYPFRTGAIVDAAITLGGRIVPVDAKFPLENYRAAAGAKTDEEKSRFRKAFLTDVKKHADDISKKYILPDENTYDFALMYVPSEAVYYEMISGDAGGGCPADYAVSKNVVPVSPHTMFAYLQTIMLGLRGLKVEERAGEIVQLIGRLRGDLARFTADFDTVGSHLNNASNRYDEAAKRLARLSAKMDNVESLEPAGKAIEE